MPKNEGLRMKNRPITNTNFKIMNLRWRTRIRLTIRGAEGDKIAIWKDYNNLATFYWHLKKMEWNPSEWKMHGTCTINMKGFYETLIRLGNELVEDKDKVKCPTNECSQIIEYIANKMEIVTFTRYEEEKDDDWQYKEFGENEYQTDIFFYQKRTLH
jgi:hypothetical protein